MREKREALLNITKTVVGVSLKVLAAAAGASNSPLLAGLAMLPAAGLDVSDTIGAYLSELKVQHEEIVRLPQPSWWSGEREWENFCAEINTHMPHILQTMAERLEQEKDDPSTQVVQRVFVEAVMDEPLTWAFDTTRRDAAAWIAAPIAQGLDAVLEPLIEQRRAEQATERLKSIDTGIGVILAELQGLRADDVARDDRVQRHVKPASTPALADETQTDPSTTAPSLDQAAATAYDIVPDPFPSAWNVPYRYNPFFADRTNLLRKIHDGFRVDSGGKMIRPQALSGPGGIGKSRFATQYAFHYRSEYDAILWVNAESSEMLRTQFITLADELKLTEQGEEEQDLMQAVIHWLTEHTKWLLVLDNADDLNMVSDFIPTTSRGHILLNSRAHAVGILTRRIKIEPMEPNEGALFLLHRATILDYDQSLEDASEQNQRDSRALVYEMGGLPLALDQVGAYIEETGCGISGYLEVYQTHAKELLQERGYIVSEHPDSVATTWLLSFENIDKNKAASELLRLCAFLHPDNIPEEIILQGTMGLQPIAASAFELNAAARELYKSSLIQRNPEAKTLTIHRLVQAALKNWMGMEAQQQWAERSVRAVHSVFPDIDSTSWSRCPRYLSQILVCKKLIKEWNFSFVEAAQLLYRAGRYLYERAQYKEAEPLYQQAIAIYNQSLGEERPEVAFITEQYADLLHKMQ